VAIQFLLRHWVYRTDSVSSLSQQMVASHRLRAGAQGRDHNGREAGMNVDRRIRNEVADGGCSSEGRIGLLPSGSLERGAVECLFKPFSDTALFEALNAAFRVS
jgi:hypothetical protein